MVERTLSSLPKFLSEGIGNLVSPGSKSKSPIPASGVSQGFEIFLQTVNRYRTIYEEERLIQHELSILQQKLASTDITQAQIRDYLCRAVYCNMLGYDVSFAYIYAVKLAQQGTLLEKRTGYLAASLLLHPGHELVLLLVNTIQKDLKSSNILENCMALTVASQVIGSEMVPALLPMVLEKLKHNRELVRQKAVMCLYRFQLLAPDLLTHVETDLEKMLFDKDPGVMAAAVHIVNHNIQQNPTKYLHLADILISILKQVISRKMSAMFEYHSVPFPWLQLKLLHCLSNIAAVDEQTSKKLCPLLIEVLQRASSKETIAYAVICECLHCISSIKPDRQLIEEASKHVGRFMRSADATLQYVGVKALIGLVKVDPYFVMDYQSLIVESLEQADQTIQRKMYKLLFQIANSTNVEAICDKLLHQLEISLDKFWRSEVITMVMSLTNKFVPTGTWQYNTKLRCLQLGGDSVTSAITESVISSFKLGCSCDQIEVKQFLVKKCVEYLMADKIHSSVIHVTAWTLAELSPLLTKLPEDKVISLYTRHLSKPDLPDSVKACLISGLQKLACSAVISREILSTKLTECLKVKQSALIKQHIAILYKFSKLGASIKICREPEELDFTLSFLDSYISQHIEDGARPHRPRHLQTTLKREEAAPAVSVANTGPGVNSGLTTSDSVYSDSQYKTGSSASSGHKEGSETKLDLSGVKKVWGKQGIIKKNEESKVSKLEPKDSADVEQHRQRQEMAAVLFGGVASMGKENIHSATFGASDQDFYASLPSGDTAGWKSFHRSQTEHIQRAGIETKQYSLDSFSSDSASPGIGNENKVTGSDTHRSDDFPNTETVGYDTGYESKLLYDEYHGNSEILGGNLELQSKSYSNPLNDVMTSHNSTLYSTENTAELNLMNDNGENRLGPNRSLPQLNDAIANVPNDTITNELEAGANRDDMDEALSMLLNDMSSYVNISVESQVQISSSMDSSDTGHKSIVKVRESIYNAKADKMFTEFNCLANEEAQAVEKETDLIKEDTEEGIKGSLYDDDDDDDA